MINPKAERGRQQQLRRDLVRQQINVPPQFPGQDPTSPTFNQYVVKKHEDDYLVCHTWNGETEGDDEVLIAKNYLLRRSVFEYSKNGNKTRNGIRYTYDDDKKIHWEREAEIIETEETEEQIIVPS